MKNKITLAILIALLVCQKSFSQDFLIKGRVVDYESGNSIVGACIVAYSSTSEVNPDGAISKDGKFEIKTKGDKTQLEFNFIGYYKIKFINIPTKEKLIDLGEIKMAQNYLMSNIVVGGPSPEVSEIDKQKDQKLRKDFLKKYRVHILGKKLKPYFEKNQFVFDFNGDRKNDKKNNQWNIPRIY